ncbi:hypothetical protein DEU56DRAFT_822010 [Suillus clintonianus]|uniref:uncharacterized protein n=1 Tax=Suillus clintonianus TaxID=1904413 RepID=UPI001B87BCBF|nr:uncharacterized protein DEU56DRAFT_822010 [Suillus clintonianus]KAG2126575.1 hypothetical protein DEU56DRAFT_822010 [Suillus clintonianus]
MASRSKYRTKICRNFVAGRCAYGTNCTFIHPPPVLFPPSNTLRPFARQPVLKWSALRPNTTDAAPVYETPFSPSPLSPAPIPGTRENVIVRPKGRRTNVCKHFVRTQGRCPLGDACNFIHDAALLSSRGSDQIQNRRDVSPRCAACAKEPWSIDNTAMGATREYCWAYIQGMCMNPGCQLLHPEDDSLYVAHTPCPRWPNCSDGACCAFQHPGSIPVAPAPLPLPLPSTGIRVPAIQNDGPPVSSETSALPCGLYEINGTKYFGPHMSVVPLPTSPSMLYDHATIAHSVCDPTIYARNYPGGTLEASSHVYDQGTYPDGDWKIHNSSDPQLLEINKPKEQLSVPVQEVIRLSTSDPGAVVDRFTSTQTSEFPYRPPENQRLGHAKRISVQMKKVEALSLTENA